MLKRKISGILLPIASLPGKDIGNFGKVAVDFLEMCARAGQSVWQVLPIGPTIIHDSPFYSPSAFAISQNYIDLDDLTARGFLSCEEVRDYYRKFDCEHPNKINYGLVWEEKMPLLRIACHNFFESEGQGESFRKFVEKQGAWLDDYACFMGIKEVYSKRPDKDTWFKWDEEFKDKKRFDERLGEFQKLAKKNRERDFARWDVSRAVGWNVEKLEKYQAIEQQADFHRFVQWIALLQWRQLKKRAKEIGIHIIGDCPIYVAPDSADVWANRQVFELDKNGDQTCYAGVPPDYFSPKYGQFWGNPIYRWYEKGEINVETFSWWTQRLKHQFDLFDELRIDHFRGFTGYWQVPGDNCETVDEKGNTVKTAKNGEWLPGPGSKLFTHIAKQLGTSEQELPIIAEDLGVITEEVSALREFLKAPGMGIFQFAPWGKPYFRTEEGDYREISDIEHLVDLEFEPDEKRCWESIYCSGQKGEYRPFLDHEFLPHNAEKNGKLVFYPGTHDNETLAGWYQNPDRTPLERKLFLNYLDYRICDIFKDSSELGEYLNEPVHIKTLRLLSSSGEVRYVITQMPDILGLQNTDESGEVKIRCNIPNNIGQWSWKMGAKQVFSQDIQKMLAEISTGSGRHA